MVGTVFLMMAVFGLLPEGTGSEREVAVCLPPVLHRSVKGCELDTTWHPIGPGFQGSRVLNKKRRWVIETTWFEQQGGSEHLFSFEELDALYARGSINDSTIFSPVTYRFVIRAPDRARMLELAKRLRPTKAPRAIVEAVMARRRAARTEREQAEEASSRKGAQSSPR